VPDCPLWGAIATWGAYTIGSVGSMRGTTSVGNVDISSVLGLMYVGAQAPRTSAFRKNTPRRSENIFFMSVSVPSSHNSYVN
jgi:hypothetical protein